MVFAKPVLRDESNIHARGPVSCSYYEASEEHTDQADKLKILKESMQQENPAIPISYLLSVQPSSNNFYTAHFRNYKAPCASNLSTIIGAHYIPFPVYNHSIMNIFYCVPPIFDNNCTFTFDDARHLQKRTSAQRKCLEWVQLRRSKFTTSNCQELCTRKKCDLLFFLNEF